MGTSNSFGGPKNGTPLIPTWLEPAPPPSIPAQPGGNPNMDEKPLAPSKFPTIPVPTPNRFTIARTNFSQFAGSNGGNGAGLGRAVSNYVSKSSGGSRQAARRMGASRNSGSRLLGFMSNVINNGVEETLQELNLGNLIGRPIDEIFLGMLDYICPDGGTIDEGIARDAFVEMIADLSETGITDFGALTNEQMKTVFELYATHTIQNRLYNDIANRAIQVPSNPHLARQIQRQLFDFIRRGVSDALVSFEDSVQKITKQNTNEFVNKVYEDAFSILQKLGELEAEQV